MAVREDSKAIQIQIRPSDKKAEPELKEFHFDHVFDMEDEMERAYEIITHPINHHTIVEESFEGFNSCVMAYGQTGSGKTHTIFGSPEAIDEMMMTPMHDEVGLVPRLVDSIFSYI